MAKRSLRGSVSAPRSLTTYQAVTLALYLEGGHIQTVDTEDVAVRTNAIAPGRFTWRKYKDQIDINSILISLRHAKRPQNGKLVTGEAATGWRLTEAGVASARSHEEQSRQAQPRAASRTRAEDRWARSERARLLSEDAFAKYSDGRALEISRKEAERFFRIDDYIVGDRRASFVTRLVTFFSDDPLLAPAVRQIKSILDGETNE